MTDACLRCLLSCTGRWRRQQQRWAPPSGVVLGDSDDEADDLHVALDVSAHSSDDDKDAPLSDSAWDGFARRLGLPLDMREAPIPPAEHLAALHRMGLVWARLVPAAQRRPLLLAPEELLTLPQAWHVTPRTDLWLATWQQLPAAAGAPAVLPPQRALQQALQAPTEAAFAAQRVWMAVAQHCGCTLAALLEHVWRVVLVLGGPPPLANDTFNPCVAVLQAAWHARSPARAAATPAAALAWHPLDRVPPGTTASQRAYSCYYAQALVRVQSRWTPVLAAALTHALERVPGEVCFVCARPLPAGLVNTCSPLCAQWAQRIAMEMMEMPPGS